MNKFMGKRPPQAPNEDPLKVTGGVVTPKPKAPVPQTGQADQTDQTVEQDSEVYPQFWRLEHGLVKIFKNADGSISVQSFDETTGDMSDDPEAYLKILFPDQYDYLPPEQIDEQRYMALLNRYKKGSADKAAADEKATNATRPQLTLSVQQENQPQQSKQPMRNPQKKLDGVE